MNHAEIIRRRLINQQLATTRFKTAPELVAWMGAIQAQEFSMARWAIGLRVPGLTDAAINDAFNRGDLLRTHIMRPTWHFVAPRDIRWMLALSAPRVNAANAYMYRQLELNEAVFKRSNRAVAKALTKHGQLTRNDLQSSLKRAGLVADGHRLSYLMMRAELDGLICSGPRKGKQFTYSLLDDRVPATTPIDRDEALRELAERYFNSRGPATVHDFAGWSGLTLREARAGVETLKSYFHQEIFDGQIYFFAPTPAAKSPKPLATFLMPEYDEYGLSYKNRSSLQNPSYKESLSSTTEKVRKYFVVLGGTIAGTWIRHPKNRTAIVDPAFLRSLSKSRRSAVTAAVRKYDYFVNPPSSNRPKKAASRAALKKTVYWKNQFVISNVVLDSRIG